MVALPLLLLPFLVVVLLRYVRTKKALKLPPGPPGWPLVGNLLQLGKKPHESLMALAKAYGPFMTLHLGMKTAIVVSSPAMAKEILKNNDRIFAGRTVIQAVKCLSYDEHSMIWCQYGHRWDVIRKVFNTELMSSKRLESMKSVRREQVFRMIGLIFEERGKSVNIGQIVFLASINAFGNMMFSRNMFESECCASGGAGEFKDIIWRIMELGGTPNIADVFPFLEWLDPQGIKAKMTECFTKIFDLFDKLIDDRLKGRSGSNIGDKDFLDILLDLKSNDGEDKALFTILGIKSLFLDMFQAGPDEISTTVEWAMSEFLKNPHSLKQAQEEISRVVGYDKRVEESDTENLPYLQAVIKEVFRLHPTAPLLSNRAETSCEIAGFHIPKHAQTIINVWAIGRDPNVWSDPLQFNPSRFLDCDIDYKGHHFELLPFGAGRRMCPGLPLGNKMVKLILASLLQSFEWSLPHGQSIDMTEKFGLALQKAVPLKAFPTPRLSIDLY
ncbi:hypothetical protein SUGI_0978650 [Cryptomeria japonica]|nr:hypothetical protein SUGI_0978650 [Cryptomeria japonica]